MSLHSQPGDVQCGLGKSGPFMFLDGAGCAGKPLTDEVKNGEKGQEALTHLCLSVSAQGCSRVAEFARVVWVGKN